MATGQGRGHNSRAVTGAADQIACWASATGAEDRIGGDERGEVAAGVDDEERARGRVADVDDRKREPRENGGAEAIVGGGGAARHRSNRSVRKP